MDKNKKTGGPCQYREYNGSAVITSLKKKGEVKNRDKGFQALYEVKFSFFPKEKIKEEFVQVKNREYDLKLENSSDPWLDFIEKYAIKEGKAFDCILKVITRGTCTPLLFDFPSIDLGDTLGKGQ
ncbi:MAG: hypothetical protein K8R53_08745 [Bacteroidales bacterium]|nr:hypothetical protein [Bacteroidales bacterium]